MGSGALDENAAWRQVGSGPLVEEVTGYWFLLTAVSLPTTNNQLEGLLSL